MALSSPLALSRAHTGIVALTLLLAICGCGSGGDSSGGGSSTAASYKFEIKFDWLTMPDGVRLSVTYFMPLAKKPGEKFPVVLEMLPYRKDDSFFLRDYPDYAFLARRGIVGARVDVRGTGSSFGALPDREYSDAELDDLEEMLKLLAKQPFSNGNVGMQGISWSAFNAIMTAMRRPPELKGILVAHGSQDLYGNDVHIIDGGLHLDIFAVEIEIGNVTPRSPDYPVDSQYFADRFDQTPWIFTYLHHQRDGDFWQKGRSLQTDYGSINVPVYAIAGLLDGYRDYVPAMLDNLKVPIKAEIGPWNHAYPNEGGPAPHYEWRDHAVRWWRQLLQGRDTGILDSPRLLAFVRGSVPADVDLKTTPGEFRSDTWPVPINKLLHFVPQSDGSLSESTGPASVVPLAYQPSSGAGALNWWGETTPDMRAADKGALIFDTAPLEKPVQVIGTTQVVLQVTSDAPQADWIARLEDVAPDGSVSLVTGGLINGAQRLSRTNPQPLVPGESVQLKFPLRFTTWTFSRGHRVRLIVSNAQFPMIWPTPYKMTTTLAVGDGSSEVILPVVTHTLPPPRLKPPQPDEERPGGRSLSSVALTPFHVESDGHGHFTATAYEAGDDVVLNGTINKSLNRVTYKVDDLDPANAEFVGEGDVTLEIGSRVVVIKTTTTIVSDAQFFHTSVVRKVSENDTEVRSREFKEDIPRDFQ